MRLMERIHLNTQLTHSASEQLGSQSFHISAQTIIIPYNHKVKLTSDSIINEIFSSNSIFKK